MCCMTCCCIDCSAVILTPIPCLTSTLNPHLNLTKKALFVNPSPDPIIFNEINPGENLAVAPFPSSSCRLHGLYLIKSFLIIQICSLYFILIIFSFDYPRRNTTSVLQDIKGCIEDLESEQQMAPIKVQLIDSNVAAVYQASKLVEVG